MHGLPYVLRTRIQIPESAVFLWLSLVYHVYVHKSEYAALRKNQNVDIIFRSAGSCFLTSQEYHQPAEFNSLCQLIVDVERL